MMNSVRFMFLVSLLTLMVSGCTSHSHGVIDTPRKALLLPEDTFGDRASRVVYPNQNWDPDDSLWFYNTPQGSHLLPYNVFLHLEQAERPALFRHSDNMNRLRYLTQQPSSVNPDGLPLGWVKETYRGKDYVGLTCAACHTGQVNYQGVAIRIDGGPTLSDMDKLLIELADALTATVNDPEKFTRFANRVLGKTDAEHQQALRDELKSLAQNLHRYNNANISYADQQPVPYGYGRLDAFGRIYNRVFAHLTPGTDNGNPANAPVSYPPLWDTPHHDFVQWNGVGDNEADGTLSRNVGQAIGVFATMDLQRLPEDAGYTSSVNIHNLRHLETHLEKLWSPRWQELADKKILPPINHELAGKGLAVYVEYQCHTCHQLIDRNDPERRIIARFSSVQQVNTDPAMANNALYYTGKSGYLEGLVSLKPPSKTFGPRVSALAAVRDVTEGVIRAAAPQESAEDIDYARRPTVSISSTHKLLDFDYVDKANPQTLTAYKARPLNGVWATAPYLHNGSVANLYELFLPSCSDDEIAAGKLCRANQFTLGSRELDPVKVGLVQRDPHDYPAVFVLDTRLPGNSNKGHEYAAGVTPVAVMDERGQLVRDDAGKLVMRTLPPISEEKRIALVEFLKTL